MRRLCWTVQNLRPSLAVDWLFRPQLSRSFQDCPVTFPSYQVSRKLIQSWALLFLTISSAFASRLRLHAVLWLDFLLQSGKIIFFRQYWLNSPSQSCPPFMGLSVKRLSAWRTDKANFRPSPIGFIVSETVNHDIQYTNITFIWIIEFDSFFVFCLGETQKFSTYCRTMPKTLSFIPTSWMFYMQKFTFLQHFKGLTIIFCQS